VGKYPIFSFLVFFERIAAIVILHGEQYLLCERKWLIMSPLYIYCIYYMVARPNEEED
jgi:hypothetical protein